jgi:hypothetical protein
MAEQVRRRLNEGLVGPLERPVLLWLAAHLPRSVTPDQLTVCGLFGSCLVFLGISSIGAQSWVPVARQFRSGRESR